MPGIGSRPARLTLAAIVLALAMGLIGAQGAAAIGIGPSGFYSFGDAGCAQESRSDPVGVLFEGTQASALNAANQVDEHAGWSHDTEISSNQWLWVLVGEEKYNCRETNYERASEPDWKTANRFHVRLWYVPASDKEKRRTVGTPHHEDWVEWPACGPFPGNHAVDSNGSEGSGFDQGRHELKAEFLAAEHSVTSYNWGNTKNFQQCDGDYAGSDGYVITISLNHATG